MDFTISYLNQVWETRKKRSVLETSDIERKERKKRSKKNVDFDELPISSRTCLIRKEENILTSFLQKMKDSCEKLEMLPLNQSLLFESPFSSVLEKIRRRKEEISKQFLSRKKSKSMDICNDEDENDFEEAEEKNEDTNLKTKSKQNPAGHDSLEEDSAGPSEKPDSPSNKRTETNPTHQV